MQNTYTIEIDAPAARVFRWINEPACMIEWVPNLVENERLTSTPNGVGSTFRQVYLERGRRTEMLGEITHFEENRRLGCRISGSAFDLLVDYRLVETDGRTRLTQESTIGFKSAAMRVIAALMLPFIRKSAMRQLEKSFVRLKQLVEDEAGARAAPG